MQYGVRETRGRAERDTDTTKRKHRHCETCCDGDRRQRPSGEAMENRMETQTQQQFSGAFEMEYLEMWIRVEKVRNE